MNAMVSRILAGAACVLLGHLGSCKPAPSAGDAPRHVRYVVGLSPFLPDGSKDETFRQVVRFLIEDMPLNSSLWLYDAFHVRTIARVDIPNVRAFASGRTRANQFKDAIQKVRQFLAETHARPELAGTDFDQALRLPQFMDFVGENLTGPDHDVVVLLVGGPLYRDDKEPGFSMADGYFPSDGHLLAARDTSVFGLKDRATALQGVTAHLGYLGDPWASEVHQERVGRFWTLFFKMQGARLATFTGDLPTMFHAAACAGQPPDARDRRYEVQPEDTKVEMLRITRDVGVADWITRDLPANTRQPPPSITVGPMKIGIRWKGAIDLDLYARPARDGETLYFEHLRSPQGYYFRDHRSSPDREFEFIEFTEPVDVWKAEASVNFYEGSAPGGAEGEIRVEFDGRIYAGRFALEAESGNKGRSGRGQGAYWTDIDIPRLLKLR